jgi:hypothetical protein
MVAKVTMAIKNNDLTHEQLIYIRKAFQIGRIKHKFNKWFDTNFIYCEDACSFVHRFFNAFEKCEYYTDAQNLAMQQLDIMRLEFLNRHYNTQEHIDEINAIPYVEPIDRLKP